MKRVATNPERDVFGNAPKIGYSVEVSALKRKP